jgi:hypothetical protein
MLISEITFCGLKKIKIHACLELKILLQCKMNSINIFYNQIIFEIIV